MRWLWRAVLLLGLLGTVLGALWFLQGSDLLHLDPVACATDCEPVVGHQPDWQIAGALTAATGLVAASVARRRLRS